MPIVTTTDEQRISDQRRQANTELTSMPALASAITPVASQPIYFNHPEIAKSNPIWVDVSDPKERMI